MPEIILQAASAFWHVLCAMSPYLLFGFLMAGLLSVAVSAESVERHLGGRGVWPVLKASVFGVPLPLCSCGVVPVAASMRRHGASRGATTAFVLSTPQTGVDSILVTLSLLGPVFAVFRPLAALVTGLIGGQLVAALAGEEDAAGSPACGDACCSGDVRGGWLARALKYGFVALPRDIGRAMLVGLLAAAVLSALVPADYFTGLLGGGVSAMLLVMAGGIPVYVCATASVPVAAALISKGVSPGVALVFLMTGPATNAAAIVTLWKVLGKRAAVVYLSTLAACALACGLLLDRVVTDVAPASVQPMAWMLPRSLETISAVALLGVLMAAMLPRHVHGIQASSEGPGNTLAFQVIGMTCSHCAANVRRALLECGNVEFAEVDLRTGLATVKGGELDKHALCRAVEALGYEVRHGPGDENR